MYQVRVIFFVLLAFGLSACMGGTKIVIPAYTAPKEVAKLSKIKTRDGALSDESYLALWIDPQIQGAKSTMHSLDTMLIDSVKEVLTQTNFIALDPLGGSESVALRMRVQSYDYIHEANKRELYLEVNFLLSRGSEEFLSKSYSERKNRQSQHSQNLPTQNELTSQAVQAIVRSFISDISPLRTNQLREFKPFASELAFVEEYAKRKNYEGAIKLMRSYKGERGMNYHYNLAVLYEAQASTQEDLRLLEYAQDHYEQALLLGGASDTLIMSAKIRFDTLYDLLWQTKKQAKANRALIQERDSMLGDSQSEYE